VDPDPGGPKPCGSGGSGFGSATLLIFFLFRSGVRLPVMVQVNTSGEANKNGLGEANFYIY